VVVALGTPAGAGRFVLLHAFSRILRQRARSAAPVIFGVLGPRSRSTGSPTSATPRTSSGSAGTRCGST